MDTRYGKSWIFFLLLVGAMLYNVAPLPAQLLVDLSVDITEEDGVFTYNYTLGNSILSAVSVNAFLLDVQPGADVTNLQQPGNWIGEYSSAETNLQVGWIAGNGIDFSNEDFDVFEGESKLFSFTSSYAPGEQSAFVGKVTADGLDFIDFADLVIDGPTVPPTADACDFDMDGDCDLVDIDELASRIATSDPNSLFDLTMDGSTNTDDLAAFLVDPNVNKLNGDLDFSGEVGFSDFLVLSSNFGQEASWSGGDIDPNGSVGFPDFLILSNNFGQTAAEVASVPEPDSLPMVFTAIFSLVLSRRRTSR